MSLLGAGTLLTVAGIFLYQHGLVWFWGLGLGPVLLLMGFLDMLRAPSAIQKELLDPDYERRPFLIGSDAFGKRLATLQQRAPQLITSGKGETVEETMYDDGAPPKELLRIKIAKLDNGKTSLVFRGRSELVTLLDKPEP